MSKHKYTGQEQNYKDDTLSANCKRFKPQDIIKMGPNARVPYEKQNPDEAPVEKHLSEADLQLKDMVKKQMNKTITLENELAREKRFLSSTVFKDDQEKRAGALSLDQFIQHTETEQKLQNLRDYGLTDREIKINVSGKESDCLNLTNQEESGLGQSEIAVKRAKDGIVEKIKSRDDALKNDEVSYSNTREMTRREMEIELSLYRSTEKAQELKHLVKHKVMDYSKDDPVMQTLKEYEDRERLKRSKQKKEAKKKKKAEHPEDDDDNDDEAFVGPLLAPLHVRVKPLDKAEVTRNKLSVDEIKSIPKFKNYDPGIPSKVLYVKNLPRDTSKEDLAKLFVRFESLENPKMEYKVMDGRMKGQAFVTFNDLDIAQKALEFANGFILRDKPIIISFGKGKNS